MYESAIKRAYTRRPIPPTSAAAQEGTVRLCCVICDSFLWSIRCGGGRGVACVASLSVCIAS
jgi:hypothetical protein